MTRILAVGAHPDDVEFMCAGTMLHLAGPETSLSVVTLTPGDCGSHQLDRAAISEVRRREAAEACRLLGAEYRCLEFEDFSIMYDVPSLRRVTSLLRELRPDVVMTHPPADYLIDHEITSRLVRSACFAAPVPNYAAPGDFPAMDAIPALVYWSPVDGIDIFGNPAPVHFFVDISDVIERKAAMLAAHSSQREWLREHHGVDEYLEMMRRWAGEAGRMASRLADRPIAYAEAFRVHRGHAYPPPDPLFRRLGSRLVAVK
jgi:LmbE family N-acetylglucosaminyl deacetylase